LFLGREEVGTGVCAELQVLWCPTVPVDWKVWGSGR
jgi:hypothetical protein